jgi:hypothetical protein
MHMPSRTAKFVSAAFAGILAGVTTASNGAAPATDNCLSGPKDQAPQGSHWYYRIEHATQRHCWYLKDEREKLSQAVSPNSPKTEPAMQRSIANAHAELPLPQAGTEQQSSAATGQPAAGTQNNQLATPPDANTQLSAVAARWPESSGIASSANSGSTASNSGTTVPSNSGVTRQPVAAAVTLAAADASSEKQSGAAHMLLIVILGALSIAGLIGSAVLRFGGTRPAGGRDLRGDPRAADDPNRRISEMLARLSRAEAT